MANPSFKIGLNAKIPNLCKVGARLRRTYLFLITSSKYCHTISSLSSINLLAIFILCA